MMRIGVRLLCVVCGAAVSSALFSQLIKDDFVLVLSCYAGFEARVVAGRGNRRGFQTVVVTNELREDAAELRKAENETWLLHKGGHLEDMAPFVAFRHLQDSFRWMFVGEDDTLFLERGAKTAVEGLAKDMPYILADTAWFIGHEGQRHYLKAEAPRCVPCSYEKDMGQVPGHFVKGCPCRVHDGPPEGFCGPHKMPSMEYFPHGGPGYLLSSGLLQKISYEMMQGCLLREDDATLIYCLWKFGIGITDPDPVWHPDGLTHFDPTPPPFLTHENIMEKTAHVLGVLLRQAAGMCTDICKEEIAHFVTLHFNVAKIGYLRSGEKRIGDFKDAGQREQIGQILLQAISSFYGTAVLRKEVAAIDGDMIEAQRTADSRLAAAKQIIEGMGDIFLEDMLGEGEVDRSGDARAALSTTEKTRIALASSVARQALDIIIQDCSGGTVI